eukprot:scaffold1982_cov93-Amphora_coffeaeformis.AAC.63
MLNVSFLLVDNTTGLVMADDESFKQEVIARLIEFARAKGVNELENGAWRSLEPWILLDQRDRPMGIPCDVSLTSVTDHLDEEYKTECSGQPKQQRQVVPYRRKDVRVWCIGMNQMNQTGTNMRASTTRPHLMDLSIWPHKRGNLTVDAISIVTMASLTALVIRTPSQGVALLDRGRVLKIARSSNRESKLASLLYTEVIYNNNAVTADYLFEL